MSCHIEILKRQPVFHTGWEVLKRSFHQSILLKNLVVDTLTIFFKKKNTPPCTSHVQPFEEQAYYFPPTPAFSLTFSVIIN